MERSKVQTVKRNPRLQQEDGPFWFNGSGSISWEKLKDLKASNPVEVSEYAIANRLVKCQPSSGGYHMSCDNGTESYQKQSSQGIGR
jgi:hypothetical protein